MQVAQVQQRQASFGGDMLQSAATRGTRDFLGQELDKHCAFKPLNVPKVDCLTYNNILGVGAGYTKTPVQKVLGTEAGRTFLKQGIQRNFSAPRTAPASLKEFAAKTLYGANANVITAPLSDGKVFTAASKVGGLAFGVAPVFTKTANVFNTTHSVSQAMGTFAKEATKEATAWEVGSIGYIIGQALVPLAGLRVMAALASMAFASTATKRLMD